jgi:hypothetical protein
MASTHESFNSQVFNDYQQKYKERKSPAKKIILLEAV